ncbi:MAG: hypothetical protein R3253_12340, partial [Longimicrobiales bacterium]|nr:hypothetical protein [Longimicrobiales bacterium]
ARQIVVAMVTITLFIPCFASVLMIARERSLRTAILLTGLIFPLAFLAGGLAGRELGQSGAAPRQLGLWLRGWYGGVSHSPNPSGLGYGARSWWPGPAGVNSLGASPAYLEGLTHGLLEGLRFFGRSP